MLKYFILFLVIVVDISLIRQYSSYNKTVRLRRKEAYTMYRNRYIKNRIIDCLLILSFLILILLPIYYLGL
jgi:hypothetical protein